MKPGHTGVIIAILGGALGQLLMKSGMQSLPTNDLLFILGNLYYFRVPLLLIIAGISSYAVSMIVWIHTLKNNELSKAYPLLSLSYVVVYLGAALWPGLQESLTLQKTLGISLIIFGVWYAQSPVSTEKA